MRGQSSRAFEQKGAFFRPIMDDDDDTCSSSSPSAGSSPVSFWPSSSTSTRCMQSEEDKVLALYDQAAKDRERMKLIKELILSEQDYVKDLEAINSLFLQPLRKRRIVPEADVGLLFSTLPAISSLNKALLGVVAKRFADAEEGNRRVDAMVSSYVQSKSSSTGAGNPFRTARGLASLANCKREECLIADAFEQMASYLKVYTIYAARYVDAMAVIRRHKTANPAFYEFLEEVKGAPECRGRDMKSLMLRPVERLCQYITILDDLVRVTPHTHGDYALLAQTAAKVKESASVAEESLMSNQLAAREDDAIAPAAAAEETRNGSGVRRRKVSVVEDARLERRRDSLAHLPGLVETSATATAMAESSNKDVGAGRQRKSWRRSLARFTSSGGVHAASSAQQRSYSVGDGSAMAGGESLLALLEREKQAGGSSSGSTGPRSLKRGGSLTNTTSAGGAPKRVQPRRTNSAAALCRYESATGATFKGNLVC